MNSGEQIYPSICWPLDPKHGCPYAYSTPNRLAFQYPYGLANQTSRALAGVSNLQGVYCYLQDASLVDGILSSVGRGSFRTHLLIHSLGILNLKYTSLLGFTGEGVDDYQI